MSDTKLFSIPQKKERLGFFGFALGLVIYFVGFIGLNVIPFGYVVISFFYAPFTIEFQSVMVFVYPLLWSIPFFFIQRTKTTI
ncbi:MAG: hypothetical protein RTU63_10925 [Candidatus Thorarchaeota archaeon]